MEREAISVELLLETLAREYGYDFRAYVRPLLLKRLRSFVQEESLASISDLEEALLCEPDLMQRTVRALTRREQAFFADADFYEVFRHRLVPFLRTYPSVRIWVPGASTGACAVSLAVVLHEEGLADRCRIYATDVSELALRSFAEPWFRVDSAAEGNYREAGGLGSLDDYFVGCQVGRRRLRPELAASICATQHSLASDQAFNMFHVIVARDLLMYFEPSLQIRAQRLFFSSLVPNGFLCLGKDELLARMPNSSSYQAWDSTLSIYRRVL